MITPGRERSRKSRQKRVAETGGRILHGRIVTTPRLSEIDWPHGTPQRYRMKRYLCRCDECKAAVYAYNRERRAARASGGSGG